jgi:dihydrofolate reductase
VRRPRIDIIAAVAENRVIGADGGLPFRLSTDLKRFKALTTGKPVIMGRKTFDSIGRPLPERMNIVVTRDNDWRAEGVYRAVSLDEAITLAARHAHATNADAVFIIGGGEIYAQAISRADRLVITHVEGAFAGDTLFPVIDPQRFELDTEQSVPAGPKDSHATRFAVYRRRQSGR